MTARLIAFEGIDGSGKGTQTKAVAAALTARGIRVATLGFPQYERSFFGRRVGEYLSGDYGSLERVHPFLAAVLFAGDRRAALPSIRAAMQYHDVVLCDRYVESNIAHQTPRVPSEEQSRLVSQIRELEYIENELPRPDLNILLDVPVAVARGLVHEKETRNYTSLAADIQEADIAYQSLVRDTYLRQASTVRDTWRVIAVCDDHGYLKDREEITREIVAVICGDEAPSVATP